MKNNFIQIPVCTTFNCQKPEINENGHFKECGLIQEGGVNTLELKIFELFSSNFIALMTSFFFTQGELKM